MPYKDKQKRKEKHRIYSRRHYEKNKGYYIKRAREARKRTALFIRDYKRNHPCLRCGESDWRCLSFHHKDPKDKSFDLSAVITMGYNKEKVIKEMEKCEILCENCHRKETWKDR